MPTAEFQKRSPQNHNNPTEIGINIGKLPHGSIKVVARCAPAAINRGRRARPADTRRFYDSNHARCAGPAARRYTIADLKGKSSVRHAPDTDYLDDRAAVSPRCELKPRLESPRDRYNVPGLPLPCPSVAEFLRYLWQQIELARSERSEEKPRRERASGPSWFGPHTFTASAAAADFRLADRSN